ncbi:MAG: antibiotic biosynthesis monooxygenase, partial [Candidatus Eremiobacteraeota bacterium]|nr:antibiotic biosynthesis monooxygenase [Candidatus Eremiobacteraeota bacterium]
MIVWTYQVAAEHEKRFLDAYGPAGLWASLFAAARGYCGTELIRCDEPCRFMTIDRWESRAAY